MMKASLILASVLVLASAASNVAFAAMQNSRTPITQGEAINECRAQEEPALNDHHARPVIDACVQRLTHVNQSSNN
jgi:hypothetical protein